MTTTSTNKGTKGTFEEKIIARKAELATRKAARGTGYGVGYASATAKRLVNDVKEKMASSSVGVEFSVGHNMGQKDAELDYLVRNMSNVEKRYYEEIALDVMKALAELDLEKRYVGKRIKAALLGHQVESAKVEDYDYRICRVVKDAISIGGNFRRLDVKALVKWGFGC